MPMIDLRGVTKRFPGTTQDAVGDLSLSVDEGGIVVLVGPSGCGKTTTLRMINRLIEPTAGEIDVAGRPIGSLPAHELRRTIGYVIQQIGLFPHRTIAQNIATVPSLIGWDNQRIEERVHELTDLVAIERSMLDRYPSELSGGQRQRVGVARALAADPPVLLMDEPFGAVDPIVREHLQRELLDLQSRLHKTIVLVTHDIDEAILIGDRVAILNTGGVLEQYATPAELLASPVNQFVSDFLGKDRGIKRLSLLPLSNAVLDPGPSVQRTDDPHAAYAAMAEDGVDWVLVLSGESILGLTRRGSLSDVASVGDAVLEPFTTRVDASETFREALDSIISSNSRYTAVCDGERFMGMLTAASISGQIAP